MAHFGPGSRHGHGWLEKRQTEGESVCARVRVCAHFRHEAARSRKQGDSARCHTSETRPFEIRPERVRPVKVRPAKVRPAMVRPAQVRPGMPSQQVGSDSGDWMVGCGWWDLGTEDGGRRAGGQVDGGCGED